MRSVIDLSIALEKRAIIKETAVEFTGGITNVALPYEAD
jgi:hypothetical protein